MKVVHFPCGPFANESERTAFEHLRSRIESSLGASDDQWMLLTNLTWSVTHQFQADEIDMIAIGPPGGAGHRSQALVAAMGRRARGPGGTGGGPGHEQGPQDRDHFPQVRTGPRARGRRDPVDARVAGGKGAGRPGRPGGAVLHAEGVARGHRFRRAADAAPATGRPARPTPGAKECRCRRRFPAAVRRLRQPGAPHAADGAVPSRIPGASTPPGTTR